MSALFRILIKLLLAGILQGAPSALQAATIASCDEATLRAGMAGGGIVTFACDGIIHLSQSIIVSNDTVLNGNGHAVTVSGNGTVGVFYVRGGVTFTVLGLTMSDGKGAASIGEGGCIRNDGTLKLMECLLTNNIADNGRGGAIYNAGLLSMTNSTLVANRALGYSDAFGGGIYSRTGEVNIVNCSFMANQAAGGNTTITDPLGYGRSGHGYGGGLYIASDSVYLSNVTFACNSANAGTVQGNRYTLGVGQGAAIYNSGNLVLMNSIFQNNHATNGSSCDGGAIFSSGSLTAFGTMFDRNLAQGAGGFYNDVRHYRLPPGPGRGGALFNSGDAVLACSTFAGNAARGGDQSDNGLLSYAAGGPAGGGYGGGIFNAGTLAITNSTLTGNVAQGGSFGGTTYATTNSAGGGYGGGICHTGTWVALTHCTLALNGAVGGRDYHLNTNGISGGGAICTFSNSAFIQGSLFAYSASGSNSFRVVPDRGYNLSSDGSCSFTNVHSLNNIDPGLGPLADNGGPTLTMSLLPGSPAIDAADPASGPVTDQRGVQRPQGAGRDIGAFEFTRAGILRSSARDWDLEFSAVPAQIYTLQASSDFHSWNDVQTNIASAAGVVVFRIQSESPTLFFRTAVH